MSDPLATVAGCKVNRRGRGGGSGSGSSGRRRRRRRARRRCARRTSSSSSCWAASQPSSGLRIAHRASATTSRRDGSAVQDNITSRSLAKTRRGDNRMAIEPESGDLERFLASDDKRPFVLAQLLRLAEGGREKYLQYSA